MEIKDRIKAARKKAKLTQPQLVRLCGWGESNNRISNYETGERTPSVADLKTIARALNVPLSSLTGESEAILSNGDESFLPIRHASVRTTAGIVGYSIEYLDDDKHPLFFKREWFDKRGYKPDKLFATEVSGESMVPSLYPGDVIVVNLGEDQATDGEVFAINYEGELVVKRMKRESGIWWLASDNQDKIRYPDKRCSEDCFVVGLVVHKQSERI